jgi:TIR domain
MQVFLSYSHADKRLAIRLRRSLEASGLSFSDPGEDVGTSWRQQVEKAIRSSDAVLLLLGSPQKADEPQQLTWRLVLEAVWADAAKPLIPILLHDAELPAFVRSGASGDRVEAIRIRDPKNPGPAVQAILRTLGCEPPEEAVSGLKVMAPSGERERPRPYEVRVPLSEVIESYPAVTDVDRLQRRERLSAIRSYAEQLKH